MNRYVELAVGLETKASQLFPKGSRIRLAERGGDVLFPNPNGGADSFGYPTGYCAYLEYDSPLGKEARTYFYGFDPEAMTIEEAAEKFTKDLTWPA